MTTPVTRRSQDPVVDNAVPDELPPTKPEGARTEPTKNTAVSSARAPDSVSRADEQKAELERQQADRSVGVGEKKLREFAESMQPGDVATVRLGAEVSAKFGAEVGVEAVVRRLEDGTFEVQIGGSVGAGLDYANKLSGHVIAGVSGTFHKQTAEGVADLLLLAAKEGALTAANPALPRLARAVGILEQETMLEHAASMDAVSVEVGGKVSAGLDDTVARAFGLEASATVKSTLGAQVDFRTGEVTFSQTLSAEAVAKLRGSPAQFLDLGGEARIEARLEAKMMLPPQMLEDLRKGRITVESLAMQADFKLKVIAQGSVGAEAFIGGVHRSVRTEVSVPLSDLRMFLNGTPAEKADLLSRMEATATLYSSSPREVIGAGIDAFVAGARIDGRIERRKATVTGSPADVRRSMDEAVARAEAEDRMLQRRAEHARMASRMAR